MVIYKTLAEMKKGEIFENKKGSLIVFYKHHRDNLYCVYFLGHAHFGCFCFKDKGQLYKMIKFKEC